MIPSPAECLQLMDKHRMLENIRDHSIIVARIAEVIAIDLRKSGVDLSLDLVVAAALLHDIGKTLCLGSDDDHSQTGLEICLAEGLDELAPLVKEHVWLKFQEGPISEKEIVYYADKRVNHDKVVSLFDRQEYIVKRYGNSDPQREVAIRKNCRNWDKVEGKIFAGLDFGPADLAGLIDQNPASFFGQYGQDDLCLSVATVFDISS
ncbi:MAG: HD domain-containing protein [Proteobacteria bacterium]|nr:HD domain-containing protein [Pseudomonadota bacterium]MBU1716172.1 HD domain-containing protein [Pseudomonadota bacterium]